MASMLELRRNVILRIVADPSAFFKNQTRDEPDLTDDEKYSIADHLFDSSPAKFLERYGKFLKSDDLPCLNSMPSNDLTEIYKNQILNQSAQKPSKSCARNRRYKKMLELVEEGEYFSEEEMKRRNPLMYERMLGKFLDGSKMQCKPMTGENFLTSFCMSHLESMQNNELYQRQLEEEERQMDCEEDDDDDDDEEDEEDEEEKEVSDKEFLQKEFAVIMKERFLQGLDENIDYEKIDNDERLDSIDMMNLDAQDKYFDEDADNGDDALDDRNDDEIQDY